jgi:YHS domain-containing protein
MPWSILRIILILLVIRALWKLLRGVLEGAGYGRVEDGRRNAPGVKLVRDPVCGVFVPPASALILRSGGETLYFCSEKCRQEWNRR